MPPLWKQQAVFCFTVDVDWASEEVIAETQDMLTSHGITPTYFITHHSEYLKDLLATEAIEAGIHPNFAPHSSHGEGFDQVIDYCLGFMDNPQCFRAHRYFDSADVTRALYQAGLRFDSNQFSFMQPNIEPLIHESGLIRFPSFFEDGTHLIQSAGLDFTPLLQEQFSGPGLKIIAVHPLDMAINTPQPKYSRRIKDGISREAMRELSGHDLEKLRNPRRGICNFVEDLLDWVGNSDFPVMTLRQLYQMHCETT